MKFKRGTGGTDLLVVASVTAIAFGCSGQASDCNANLNCGPASGATGTSGASGGGGDSGASGASGSSGSTSTVGAGGGGGNSSSGAANGGQGGLSGESGSAGEAGMGASPLVCDGASTPDVDPCVISDAYGVFVSNAGHDDVGDGTQANPFATLSQALSSLKTLKRVYLCAADYSEPSTLEIADRVEIYGGFSCDQGVWAYDATIKAHVSSLSPVGATVSGATHGVRLQDVRLDAAAADDGSGASSFGLIVNASQNVVLTRVELRAGKGGLGKAGANGATGSDGLDSGPAQQGAPALCTNAPVSQLGGASAAMICDSQGGNGGAARRAISYAPSQDGDGGFLVEPANGAKGAMLGGQSAADGGKGADGAPGALGKAAETSGTFSETGYTLVSGGPGGPGTPGQGGGGGGASLGTVMCVGASGGAGGMGGCGGDPGAGGTGGGASVALLSWNSSVTLDACVLVAASGGAGGNGGVGHPGGLGKSGGAGGLGDVIDSIGDGGQGGKGGTGGNGGSGAGGTGGPSIALVYSGAKPIETNATTYSHAPGGARGIGGQLGMSSASHAPDGSVGVAEDVHGVL